MHYADLSRPHEKERMLSLYGMALVHSDPGESRRVLRAILRENPATFYRYDIKRILRHML